MKLKKRICFVLIIMCIFSLSSCSDTSAGTRNINLDTDGGENGELSAWISYWDMDKGIKELSKTADKVTSVSVFAVYFKNDGSLYIPEEISRGNGEVSNITNKNNINRHISFVNDVIDEKGDIIQKDPNIVRKLLNNPAERAKHIESLISYAVNNGYFGIEIDYEKVDEKTWPDFVSFCGELYKRCGEKKINLRVVLEPKAPIDRYNLPDGPEYVMMAYNLYGLSTEPGPKADVDFIKQLSEKINSIPGKKWLAFSTGGFDWQNGAETKGVTESEALDIISVYKCLPARDDKSGCLYFYYTDENGGDHTVWYADNVTLDLWIKTAKEQGYSDICVWRFGGNVSETLEQVKNNFVK